MLRHSPAALTTPQIVARTRLGRVAVARRLAEQEAAGAVGRSAGTPQRRYRRIDLEGARACQAEARARRVASGFAALAATDTLRDSRVPVAGRLEHTRKTWGPFDVAGTGKPQMSTRPG